MMDEASVKIRRSSRKSTTVREGSRRRGVQYIGEEDVASVLDVKLRVQSGRRTNLEEDSDGSTACSSDVEQRSRGDCSTSTDEDDTYLDRDSGLGNDSHLVTTWSSLSTHACKHISDSFDLHLISIAALNGLTNIRESKLLRKLTGKRKAKALLIETAWPSTVWYVPPPFEDQSFVINNLFEKVRSSKEYGNMIASEKHILEAKFEIVNSEASFLKSLLTLENNFIYSNEFNDENILSRGDKNHLFAEIPAVIKCSKNFLLGFIDILSKDPFLRDVFQFMKDFANKNFHIFIKYCSNLKYILETQKILIAENPKFCEALKRLEENPVCERLPLNSFLTLPLGRILKLDLPVREALKKMNEDHPEFRICTETSEILKQFGYDCNEGAKRFECLADTLKIANKLDFPVEMPVFPISCSSRQLLRQGSLLHHNLHKSTMCTVPVHIFLFNDVLVVSSKQSDECYVVKEYCSRELTVLTSTKGLSHLPSRFSTDIDRKYLLLTMVKDQDSKTEMVLSCETESERQAWLEAVEIELVQGLEYRAWNRPLVSVMLPFMAENPSQLSLKPGDEVRVLKRIDSDWYEGVRVSDGSSGLFPGGHTTMVSVAQAQAMALKKFYLLLNEENDSEDPQQDAP